MFEHQQFVLLPGHAPEYSKQTTTAANYIQQYYIYTYTYIYIYIHMYNRSQLYTPATNNILAQSSTANYQQLQPWLNGYACTARLRIRGVHAIHATAAFAYDMIYDTSLLYFRKVPAPSVAQRNFSVSIVSWFIVMVGCIQDSLRSNTSHFSYEVMIRFNGRGAMIEYIWFHILPRFPKHELHYAHRLFAHCSDNLLA